MLLPNPVGGQGAEHYTWTNGVIVVAQGQP